VPLFLLLSAAALGLVRLALPPEQGAWTGRALAELAALAAGPMAVAYPLWERGVRAGDHSLLGLASFFVPVLSLAIASSWLRVAPGPGLAAGVRPGRRRGAGEPGFARAAGPRGAAQAPTG
jgi:drug/metabolite transporter (DMT)-like permease